MEANCSVASKKPETFCPLMVKVVRSNIPVGAPVIAPVCALSVNPAGKAVPTTLYWVICPPVVIGNKGLMATFFARRLGLG